MIVPAFTRSGSRVGGEAPDALLAGPAKRDAWRGRQARRRRLGRGERCGRSRH